MAENMGATLAYKVIYVAFSEGHDHEPLPQHPTCYDVTDVSNDSLYHDSRQRPADDNSAQKENPNVSRPEC